MVLIDSAWLQVYHCSHCLHDRKHGDSVELGAPVMIRQQNVCLCVKPCFDQFSSPISVSSSERNG